MKELYQLGRRETNMSDVPFSSSLVPRISTGLICTKRMAIRQPITSTPMDGSGSPFSIPYACQLCFPLADFHPVDFLNLIQVQEMMIFPLVSIHRFQSPPAYPESLVFIVN